LLGKALRFDLGSDIGLMILYSLVAFSDDAIHRRLGLLRLRQGGVSIVHVRRAHLAFKRLRRNNGRVRLFGEHPIEDVADVIGDRFS
jgi:hypothetical protein